MAHAQARALSTGVGARTTTAAAAQRTAAVAPVASSSSSSSTSSSSTRRRKLQSPRKARSSSSPVSAPASSSAAAASADSSASSSSSASASASASAAPSPSRRSRAGRATYAPATFDELVDDASAALLAALDDGLKRIEVEFPALPGDKDGYSGSSDQYIDNNVRFALSAARFLALGGGAAVGARKRTVRVLTPDATELARCKQVNEAALRALGPMGVSVGHLREAAPSRLASLAAAFGGGGGGGGGGGDSGASTSGSSSSGGSSAAPAANGNAFGPPPVAADVYIVVNASTVELPDAEKYANALPADAALVFWNLELDTLRADLGLFGFPGKDLQFRFLCQFTPAFYVRPRDYAASVAAPPFLINYSGALFREWPGPWQVMLKQDSGEYACVAEDRLRYALGEAKAEMAEAMGLDPGKVGAGSASDVAADKVRDADSGSFSFLRRGVRVSTWWEDAFEEEKAHDWRK